MPGLFAKLAFAASFILPAAREVPKMKDCAELPYMLGLAWARARRRMAIIGAPEVDSHGYELEDSLRDSVMYVLRSNGFTFRELKDFLPRVEHEYLSIYRVCAVHRECVSFVSPEGSFHVGGTSRPQGRRGSG